jgi:hypothetical protein
MENKDVRIIGIANTAIEAKVEIVFIAECVHLLFTILAHCGMFVVVGRWERIYIRVMRKKIKTRQQLL